MFATRRRERPILPSAELCPLCPSRPGRSTEIPAPDYDVVVFENRFPVLRGAVAGIARHALPPRGPEPVADPQLTADPLPLAERPGYGRCEVVCFTAEHDASFASLSARRVRTVLEAWADRTRVLGAIPGVQHVYCFENRGEEVGVTLHHPHGQVYAFPFVPPRTSRLLARARAHRASSGRNLFDDLVTSELSDGRRVVARNDHWIAFVPRAARWPYEVMLFPARRVPDLPALGDPAAPRSATSTATFSSGWTGCSARRCPTSPPGSRRRCGAARPARSSPCTCRCFRSGEHREKSSSWPERSQRRESGPTTYCRRRRLAGSGRPSGEVARSGPWPRSRGARWSRSCACRDITGSTVRYTSTHRFSQASPICARCEGGAGVWGSGGRICLVTRRPLGVGGSRRDWLRGIPAAWTSAYRRRAVVADFSCAVAAGTAGV